MQREDRKEQKKQERYCDGTGKQKNIEGKELSVRGVCEIRGVNSQGWMVESREEQKAQMMKVGSNHDTTANIFWLPKARASIALDSIVFRSGLFPHFHAKKNERSPFFFSRIVEKNLQQHLDPHSC